MLWQLTQMLWVGGLWLLHIGLLPVLGRIGLAPLLVDEIAGMLNTLMVGFATACVGFSGFGAGSGQGPCQSMARYSWATADDGAVWGGAMYFAVHVGWPHAAHWQLFSYLVLGFSGLVLVMQPVPGWSVRVREAHP